MRRARIKAIPSAAPTRRRQLNKPPENTLKESPTVQQVVDTKVEESVGNPELEPKSEGISFDKIIVKCLDEPTIEPVSIDNVVVKPIHESDVDDDVNGAVNTPVIEFVLPERSAEPEKVVEQLKSPLKQFSLPSDPPETREIIEPLKIPSKESRELPKSPLIITSPRPTIGSPSPTKLISNRSSFIRPSPRLDGNSRIRRNSVQGSGASASESEDDSRRQNGIIQSKKSNTGGTSQTDKGQSLNDNNNSDTTGRKKKKMIISDSAKRLMESRREFNRSYGTKIPDKSKMKMYDLIFYNPRNNPMKKKEKSVNPEEAANNTTEADDAEDEDEEEDVDDPDSSPIGVPQIKFGPDGKLIIDRESLVINTDIEKERKKLSRSDNGDGENKFGGFYRRKKKSKDWLKYDTIKFYKALSTVGTDFSMMQSLFPDRPRQNLKLKFKKEEKIHPDLIQKALSSRHNYDVEQLKIEFNEIDKTLEKELEMTKSKKSNKKNEPGKRGRKRKYESMARSAIPEVDNDNENADSDCDNNNKNEEIENSKKSKKPPKNNKNKTKYKGNSKQKKSIKNTSDNDDDDVEEVDTLVYNARPTRSGRVAKLKTVKTQCRTILDEIYTEDDNNAQKTSTNEKSPSKGAEEDPAMSLKIIENTVPNIKNAEPGSFVICSDDCPNEPGKKIIKLFMLGSDTEPDDTSSGPSMNKNNETLSDAVSDQ